MLTIPDGREDQGKDAEQHLWRLYTYITVQYCWKTSNNRKVWRSVVHNLDSQHVMTASVPARTLKKKKSSQHDDDNEFQLAKHLTFVSSCSTSTSSATSPDETLVRSYATSSSSLSASCTLRCMCQPLKTDYKLRDHNESTSKWYVHVFSWNWP